MSEAARHRRIDQARTEAGLSVQQLWLNYISLSGIADLFEVDAYLHGLIALDPYQEDKLSYVLNERLDERHRAAMLPYAFAPEGSAVSENPLEVLRELIERARQAGAGDGLDGLYGA